MSDKETIEFLKQRLGEIREVYAGAEMWVPKYATEAYLMTLIKSCYDIAVETLKEVK